MKVSLTGLSTHRSPAAQKPSQRVPKAKPSATMSSASTPPSDTKYQSIKCLKPVNLKPQRESQRNINSYYVANPEAA